MGPRDAISSSTESAFRPLLPLWLSLPLVLITGTALLIAVCCEAAIEARIGPFRAVLANSSTSSFSSQLPPSLHADPSTVSPPDGSLLIISTSQHSSQERSEQRSRRDYFHGPPPFSVNETVSSSRGKQPLQVLAGFAASPIHTALVWAHPTLGPLVVECTTWRSPRISHLGRQVIEHHVQQQPSNQRQHVHVDAWLARSSGVRFSALADFVRGVQMKGGVVALRPALRRGCCLDPRVLVSRWAIETRLEPCVENWTVRSVAGFTLAPLCQPLARALGGLSSEPDALGQRWLTQTEAVDGHATRFPVAFCSEFTSQVLTRCAGWLPPDFRDHASILPYDALSGGALDALAIKHDPAGGAAWGVEVRL